MKKQLKHTRGQRIVALIFFLILCLGTAGLSSWITTPALPVWYQHLNHPPLTPPNWVFGPVWTLLYIMMASAAWRVWDQGGWNKSRGALSLFFIQLMLNGIWSALFFGLQRPDLALVEIVLLWLAIGMTFLSFWKANSLAGALLIPYWVWVTFAVYLNWGFWRLNS